MIMGGVSLWSNFSAVPQKGREREKEERSNENIGEGQKEESVKRLATCQDKEYISVCESAYFYSHA